MRVFKSILLILIVILTIAGCSSGGDYVIDIGGDKIDKGEFMVYLKEQKKSFEQQGGSDIWEADFDGVSAIEVAKQNAVNSIVMVKSAVSEAKSLGITLDESDTQSLQAEADDIITEFSQDELNELGLNRDKIIDVLKETKLQSKVFAYITDSYVVNESAFDTYYADYKAEHSEQFNTFYIKELFLQRDDVGSTVNYDKAQKAVNDINNGKSFVEAAKAVEPESNYDTEELEPSLYGDDAVKEIYAMAQGETKLVEDTEGYYVIQMAEIKAKNEDEVKASVRENYINERKQEIYQEQSKNWAGNVEVKRNDSVWNSIKII